jgi:pilus assembly protein CpaC
MVDPSRGSRLRNASVVAVAIAFGALGLGACTQAIHDDRPPRPPSPGAEALKTERPDVAPPAPPTTITTSTTEMRSIVEEAGVSQEPPAPPPVDPPSAANGYHAPAYRLSSAQPALVVQAGKSQLIALEHPVRRVSVGDPEIADIVLVSPTDVLVNGRKPGDTSLIFWDQHGVSEVHTITVEETSERQVLLEVTVAELNRTAMEQHGVDYRVLRTDLGLVFQPAKIAPLAGAFPPQINQPPFQFQTGDNVTLGVLDPKRDIAAFFEFIQQEGLGKILARPRLIARSGREAKFLSGGEIPIVIAEALQTSVTFKEFGTRMRFKPTVLADDTIDLEVAPEVSQPDFANGVNLFGFRVPAFITRRADTRVILRDGETLVIAGLFNEIREENQQKVPYLGDVPFFGYLFRKTSYNKTRNELMIVVRTRLVNAVPPGVSVSVPDRGPLRGEDVRTQPTDAPITRPRLSRPVEADERATTGDTKSTPDTPIEPGVRARAHGWSVQVTATTDRAAADALIGMLNERGYPAYEAAIQHDGQSLYRVRVGAYRSMEEAVKEAARLRRERGVREAVVVSD